MRFPAFRVFYSGTYTFLFLLTLVLLCVTPGDGIYQSFVIKQLWNVAIIGGTYLLTIIVAIFIYATRLFVSRQHLASIPRSHVPIRKGDLPKSARQVILDGLRRSALIAYNARPRDLKENENTTPAEVTILGKAIDTLSGSDEDLPPWGKVAHSGWASPASHDLPNVHYDPVLLELPHLIEAKAVSLAPPDPLIEIQPSEIQSDQPTVVLPDPVAVSLLQRLAALTLRDYLAHLTSLGMLSDLELQYTFISQYEEARFSAIPTSEHAFRNIMASFSSLLRNMTVPDPVLLADAAAETSSINSSSSLTSRPSSIRSSSYAESVVKHYENNQGLSKRHSESALPLKKTSSSSPYPASLSSNDGDRDDSGSEHTAYTAWTRPGQRSASRYTAYSGKDRTPMRNQSVGENMASSSLAPSGNRNTADSISSDAGSVIRKIITGSSMASGGSVIVRRDLGHRGSSDDEYNGL